MTHRVFLVVTLPGRVGGMAANEPIDPVVRLAISQWPDDAPRGAVTTFCVEYGISRKSFYELRKRAGADGQAAVLEPRSRRPRASPSKLTDIVKAQAIAVRAALASSGLDHGPISVHDKMASMGLPVVPSTASLARIFREAGVARLEPKKKPRAAWRRFVYPAPNACWQLDATEYVLTGGRKCVIFQLIDDHSRYAVASHVAWSETAQAAITVVDKGITAHGVPQRLLTDNGLALNPSRRGQAGQLFAHVTRMGVHAITGRPYKPTTQGKNERFHQTLFRWLDAQPLATTLDQLQAQVDTFDHIYNTQRPHQALPGRVTPETAWHATPKADPPRPRITPPLFRRPDKRPDKRPDTNQLPAHLPAGTVVRKLTSQGIFTLDNVHYLVDAQHGFEHVHVTQDEDQITVIDHNGEVLLETHKPAPGTKYVGRTTHNPEPSPKS